MEGKLHTSKGQPSVGLTLATETSHIFGVNCTPVEVLTRSWCDFMFTISHVQSQGSAGGYRPPQSRLVDGPALALRVPK
jgi:hypothetical protein